MILMKHFMKSQPKIDAHLDNNKRTVKQRHYMYRVYRAQNITPKIDQFHSIPHSILFYIRSIYDFNCYTS